MNFQINHEKWLLSQLKSRKPDGANHHLAMFAGAPITPSQVAQQVGISSRYARELLHRLTDDAVLIPVTGKQRTRSYRLNPSSARVSFHYRNNNSAIHVYLRT